MRTFAIVNEEGCTVIKFKAETYVFDETDRTYVFGVGAVTVARWLPQSGSLIMDITPDA